ncbi:MAG: winged helix-turn-helix domain-containing protein [Tepidiformaceae bacterium]
MNSIALISREPKLRRMLSKYLKGRKEFKSSHISYDDAIESLDLSTTEILIVDIQGIPRGQTAISITGFTRWLAESVSTEQCAVIYLLRKGIRKPKLNYSGPIVKKPFPLERIGETIRFLRDERVTHSKATTLTLNSDINLLSANSTDIHLTETEANLLSYLMQYSGEMITYEKLLTDVWKYHDTVGANILVRAQISNLRRKLRRFDSKYNPIQTIRGKGYRFVA